MGGGSVVVAPLSSAFSCCDCPPPGRSDRRSRPMPAFPFGEQTPGVYYQRQSRFPRLMELVGKLLAPDSAQVVGGARELAGRCCPSSSAPADSRMMELDEPRVMGVEVMVVR